MEEEEARLKALLDETSDYDERKKIRAELRAVRMKKLDAMSESATAESNDRAARRAERAKARQHGQENGEAASSRASRRAKDSEEPPEVEVSDAALEEMDEEALQNLLNELPSSQYEVRRKVRAKLREVKKRNSAPVEVAEPSYTRRTKETKEVTRTEEPSGVTVETTVETTTTVETHRGVTEVSDDDISFKISIGQSNGEVDEYVTQIVENEVQAAVEEAQVAIDGGAQEGTFRMEVHVNGIGVDRGDGSVAVVEEPVPVEEEAEKQEEPVIESEPRAPEPVEPVEAEEVHEEPVALEVEQDSAISLEIKFDQQLNISAPEPEPQEPEPAPKEPEPAPKEPEPVAPGPAPKVDTKKPKWVKDAPAEKKPMGKLGNRWGSQAAKDDNKAGKPGDFRTGLKKTGRAGSAGKFNLEKKSVTVELKKPEVEPAKPEPEPEPAEQAPIEPEVAPEEQSAPEPVSKPADKPKPKEPPVVDKKPAGKVGSRWGPQAAKDDKAGKPGDFKAGLKKTGRAGSAGKFNIEKKTTTIEVKTQVTTEAEPAPEPAEEAPKATEAPEEAAEPEEPQADVADEAPPPAKVEAKPAGKLGSRWAPQNQAANKGSGKPGDFRDGLKKSGRIGTGTVHLEKKGPSHGEQVDFRDSNLKKSGRLAVSLEKKPNTAGAQVDFRAGNLKKSGLLGKPTVNLEKNNSTKGAQVDFRGGLKQSGDKAAVNVKVPFSAGRAGKPKDAGKPKEAGSDDGQEASEASVEPAVETPVEQEPEPEPEPEPELEPEPPKPKVEPPKPKVEPPKSKFPQVKQKVSPFGAKVADKKPVGKSFQNAPGSRFGQKKETPAPEPQESSARTEPVDAAAAVNGAATQLENTTISEAQPCVEVKVTEHEETTADTTTKTTTTVEEKKGPGGRSYQRREETTTTKKSFVDPELKQRMALRQREKFEAKKNAASNAKNKRMAFMQKLDANAPTQPGPSHIKRSGSNVDKLLAWCRFKTRGYEGIQLNNFSSSWADGLAFCALIHIYIPEKIPYEELLAGKDRRRNFEIAFSVASEAGIAELLEVDDMMSVTNPEPKSVMTYVSTIYKHFNPS